MSLDSDRIFIDSFERITTQDIRRLVGGRRKLQRAEAVTVHLPDGRDAFVTLVRGRANLGDGQVIYAACPGCERPVVVLRVTPDIPPLLCRDCVRKKYSAIYLCQLKLRVGERQRCAVQI